MRSDVDVVDAHALGEALGSSARRLGAVGAQATVHQRGRVIDATHGLADRGAQVPVDTGTRFQIGSTTKLFTAVLALQLVDEGSLELDEPVSRWLGDQALAGAATRTTLRHLLSMTAGLDNGPYSDHGRRDGAVARYVAAADAIPRTSEPGAGFGYSNAATTVAGRLVEVATGDPWEAALRGRVTEPLRLERTRPRMDDDLTDADARGYVAGEDGEPTLVPRTYFTRALAPAGSTLWSCARDLARLGAMLNAGGTLPDGPRLLSPATVAAMHDDVVELPTREMARWWGLGPFRREAAGPPVHGHTGSNIAGSSCVLWWRGTDTVLATTSNLPVAGLALGNAVAESLWPGSTGGVLGVTEPPAGAAPVDPSITGVYLGAGVRHDVTLDPGGIAITTTTDHPLFDLPAQVDRADLVHVEGDLYRRRGAPVGNDIAFVRRGDGAVSHLVHGVFAVAREVS